MKHLLLPALSAFLITACTQSTPSMMNNNKIQLAQETVMEQIPLTQINDHVLSALAREYESNGSGVMDLTMTYDPVMSNYTAMRARNTVMKAQSTLKKKGVHQISAQTLAVPDGKPSLMVSFDVLNAIGPANCDPMPGLHDYETGRFLKDYRFGCATDTLMARQIAHPEDLQGNADMDVRSGRRASVVVEGYSAGEPRTPLEGIERDDLASE